MATRTYYIDKQRLLHFLNKNATHKPNHDLSWFVSPTDDLLYIYIDTAHASYLYRDTAKSRDELPIEISSHLNRQNMVLGCVEDLREEQERENEVQISDILEAIK